MEKERNDIFLIVPPTRSYTQRLPLAAMCLSSYLESKGEKNTILDFKGFDTKKAYQKIQKRILEAKPEFIGITAMVSEVNIVKDMCDFIKRNSRKTTIVIGGPHPSICPHHFVDANVKFDFIVIGEGEITFYELIETLRKKGTIKEIHGIAYVDSGRLKFNEPRELIQDLDGLPLPAYDKVDMEYYCRPNVWGMRPIYISSFTVFTSRGCPYNCKFCVAHTIWGRRVRMMSAERIVQHVSYILKKFKIDALYFGDESFTLSKERIYKIFNLLRQKRVKLLFGCQTRVNLLDEELLKFMKQNGCFQLDLGIESGSDRMLKIMNKQITVEMAAKVARICRKIKLRQLANMLVNVPGETLEDIEKSLKFVKDMRYNVILWNVYCPYPGISWGRILDMEDLDIMLKNPSKETFDLLEKKYKFGNYRKNINDVEDYLYSNTFHPKHLKLSLKPYYWYSLFLNLSFIFDLRYISQLLKSKRKMQYITNLFTQRTSV